MNNDALLCVGQKAFIKKGNQVLVLFDENGHLDFPGGKIQADEVLGTQPASLILALKREVREETGLEIEVANPFAVWYYKFPVGHRNYPKTVYLVAFVCKYVSGEVVLSNEHSQFKWVDESNYKAISDHNHNFGILEKYFQLPI